jgi:hypothetical protein
MKTPSWLDILSNHHGSDGVFRVIVVILASIFLINYSSLFEERYSEKLTELYIYPWWRILVVLLVITSAMWCPRVGIIIAFVVFFYLSDMNTLITPFTNY